MRLSVDLAELRKHWDNFGKKDPLWAILTNDANKGNKGDLGEFFKSGEAEIQNELRTIASLGVPLCRGRALDFGCGMGRHTQALCHYFEQCYGVDIASSMIELAQKYNRFSKKARYFVNTVNDLNLFEDASFDFVFTVIVLQHMEPRFSTNYVCEFMRVLAPGGVAVFQIPSRVVMLGQETARLPSAGFRAGIRLLESPSAAIAATGLKLRVEVTNLSSVRWIPVDKTHDQFHIRLGNHWLDERGKLEVLDDGRAGLPPALGPGETTQVELIASCPSAPGRYQLELDLVQEGVNWFKERGSATAVYPIEIHPRGESPIGANPVSVEEVEPKMEMHCMPKSEVLRLVSSHGGRVLLAQRDNACGPRWESYRYYVRKEKARWAAVPLLSQIIRKLIG